MKVVILSNSDIHGGAAVVTRRMTDALVERGVDASMLVLRKGTEDPAVHQYTGLGRRVPFLLEHADIFLHNGLSRKNLFTVSTGKFGVAVENHPLVRQADVVILGWVNQGFVSLKSIRAMAQAGKKIVWFMHDMWNATALCHHAGYCGQWRQPEGCRECPLLPHNSFSQSLTRQVWQTKRELYAAVPITFVAVSTWLQDSCLRSTLMHDCRVEMLPNILDTKAFEGEPARTRSELGLPERIPLVLMCAARLDDPIKGLPDAINALNGLGDGTAHAVFVGALKNPGALKGLRLSHTHIGPVKNPAVMRDIFLHSAVVLSTSAYETLPTTLIEGQAAGAWPVSYNRGGQADIITDRVTGSLCMPDTEIMADDIRGHLQRSPERTEILRQSAARFSPEVLIDRLLKILKS